MKRRSAGLAAAFAALVAAAHGQQPSPPATGEASMQAAYTDFQRGDRTGALADLDRAAALFRQAGDTTGEGKAELWAGLINGGLHTAEGKRQGHRRLHPGDSAPRRRPRPQ